jgi:hypothetical protein
VNQSDRAPTAEAAALYNLAEEARRICRADSASLSAWEPPKRRLRTLVNAGRRSSREERWPEDEVYPLASFPVLAALIQHREPYVFTPDAPGDVASAALAAALEKTSQAGAPVMLGGALWGELWVATCGSGRILGEADRERIAAAADFVSQGLRDLGFAAPLPVFQVAVRGRVGSKLLRRWNAHAPTYVHGMTLFEVALDATQSDELVSELTARSFDVVRMELAIV